MKDREKRKYASGGAGASQYSSKIIFQLSICYLILLLIMVTWFLLSIIII